MNLYSKVELLKEELAEKNLIIRKLLAEYSQAKQADINHEEIMQEDIVETRSVLHDRLLNSSPKTNGISYNESMEVLKKITLNDPTRIINNISHEDVEINDGKSLITNDDELSIGIGNEHTNHIERDVILMNGFHNGINNEWLLWMVHVEYKEIMIGKYMIQNVKYCRLNTLTHQARLHYRGRGGGGGDIWIFREQNINLDGGNTYWNIFLITNLIVIGHLDVWRAKSFLILLVWEP